MREQVGPDYPLLYRYSVEEPYEGGLSMDDGLAFAEMLEPLVDAFDVSAGNYDTAMTLLPMAPPGSLLKYAKAVKQRVSKPVIGVGRLVWLLDELQKAVGDGELDFVALGRAGLADPEVVAKTQRGEKDRVRRCIAVNECISRWMFNGKRTQCVINPALSQEKRAAEALTYNGLVMTVEKRRSHGWQASGSYTFSRVSGLQPSSGGTASAAQFSTPGVPHGCSRPRSTAWSPSTA